MAIRGFRVASAFIVVAGVASGALARPATAGVRPSAGTTITVNATVDDTTVDGNCSLREALQAANSDRAVDACPAGNGDDTIVLGAHTYDLDRGWLSVQSDVTIEGAGASTTFIDDTGTACATCRRAILVLVGDHLTMAGITVEHAATAFVVQGALDLSNSAIDSENESCGTSRGDDAGAIQSAGNVQLQNVHIAHTGDAIFNQYSGTFAASGLTMFDNGPCHGGQSILNAGHMTLANSTLDGDINHLDHAASIGNDFTGTVTIGHSRFMHDTGGVQSFVIDNGGTATITDSAFDDNTILPIYNDYLLTLRRDRISANRVGYHEPGAIENNSVAGFLMTATTIDHNVGAIGGAITNDDEAHATLLNDTITDNAALDGPGSGPRQLPPGGAITNAGIMMIRNVTVARNRVLGFHDWHYHAGGIVTMPHGYSALSNSIVSDNAADLPAISPDCFGNIHSLGYNLVLTATNCFIGANATGNVLGESARLPALADNGGPTMTSLPPADSPAVDAANPAAPNADDATTCSPFDQRGIARPRDGNADGISRCDMGAVER